MKAVWMTRTGGPEVLRFSEVESACIRDGREMLVRLRAAGVNPIDTKLRRSGRLLAGPERMILGCDGAGVVESVGDRVRRFRAGDEVYFCSGGIGGLPGTYAELATVDERFVAHKPRCLSFAEAAASPLVLITAWEALCAMGRLERGDQVLVHGGAGGVGHVAVQLAKQRGARVCATVGSVEKARLARDLGAEEAILYREMDFREAVGTWTGGRGVDLAVDTVGGETFWKTFSAVRCYGRLVTLLLPDPDAGVWLDARLRNLRVGFEWMLAPMFHGLVGEQERQARILGQCGAWFDSGVLRVCLSRTFPLERAAEAHRLLESGSMTGKISLVMPA